MASTDKGEETIVSTIENPNSLFSNITSQSDSLILVGTIILFILLVTKEVISASNESYFHKLSKILNISLIPLLGAFISVLIIKVAEVLRK